MKLRFARKFFGHLAEFHIQKLPPLYTVGITNETEDCYFIPFIDLDNVYQETAIKYIKLAQREFNLSPAILLSSSGEQKDSNDRVYGNYMAIMFDKMRYHDVVDLLRLLPVDELSIKMPRYYKYKSWVLRMEDKFDSNGDIIVGRPKYLKTILPENSDYLKHKHSEAHFHFLRKLFKFGLFKINSDNLKELTFVSYNTKGKYKTNQRTKMKYEYYPDFRSEMI